MKTPRWIPLAAAVGLLAAGAMPADATVLWETLLMNQVSTYQDQNREIIIDMDSDNTVSVGDVFIGFVNMDNAANGSDISSPKDLYAVFSIEVASRSSTAVGEYLTFKETSVDGLKITDLVDFGGLTLESGEPVAAVYEDVGTELLQLDQSAPYDYNSDNAFDMFDFVDYISGEGTLDLVIGFQDSDDLWESIFNTNAGLAAINNIVAAASVSLNNGPTLGDFDAGLSILWNAQAEFLEKVPLTHMDLSSSIHELTISNGQVFGAGDQLYTGTGLPDYDSTSPFDNTDNNPFFGTITVGQNTYNYVGAGSNANFSVYAVPEPGTLILLGTGLIGAGAFGRRRTKKAKKQA